VTNLNPFASSWAIAAGIASIVPDECRATKRWIPARVFRTIRLVTAIGRALPIEWIDIPHNDFVAKFFVDPFLLPRGNGSIRRPQQSGPISRRAVNRVIGFLQFTPHGFVGHFSESWMRPTVIADFMTLASGAGDNLRMVGNVLADHKKGCLDVVRAQKIEKFRCKLRAGAIVESQGNVMVHRHVPN